MSCKLFEFRFSCLIYRIFDEFFLTIFASNRIMFLAAGIAITNMVLSYTADFLSYLSRIAFDLFKLIYI